MIRSCMVWAFMLVSAVGCGGQRNRVDPAELYWLMNRACFNDELKSVESLLDAGADPNGVKDYELYIKSGGGSEPSWPINLAARAGNAEVVKVLLEAGANPQSPEGEGQTALSMAAEHGHLEVVRLLLDAGADPSYSATDGYGAMGTAAEIARRTGHEDVATLIDGHGAR